jgi:hypothetical protein
MRLTGRQQVAPGERPPGGAWAADRVMREGHKRALCYTPRRFGAEFETEL